MNRTRVLLLFGGESSEHDVSIASVRNVHAAIDGEKYDVQLCYIDRQGRWWLSDAVDTQVGGSAAEIVPVLGRGCFVNRRSGSELVIDVILPVLHGRGGEDGSVQGLAQLLHIPIVGCDVTASSIGMDKLASKEIVAINGVKIVPYVVNRADQPVPDFDMLAKTLGTPLFVKPARAGSSVGVSKVHDADDLARALADAHRHDNVALIEQAIAARELEVAVLGTPPHHRVSGVGEVIPGAEFYSYDDKYSGDSKATVIVPAAIARDTTEQLKALASSVYQALGCSGLARIDFFLDSEGVIYFNEINTLPGFTDISMYPKLWQQEGVSYSQLIDMLIGDARRVVQ